MTALAGVLSFLLVINLLTYVSFALDKWLARTQQRRIPEKVLLRLALMGGSPSAKLAQAQLRHKTRKQPFATRLNRIVLIQVLLLAVVAAASRATFFGGP